MRKFYSAMVIALSCALNAAATNVCYTYTYLDEYDEQSPVLGFLAKFSDNGRWAVGGDEYDESGCFIIDTQAPEELIQIKGGMLFDITDDGMAVGNCYDNRGTVSDPVNYARPAYYKDGEWSLLPMGECSQAIAQAVTRDGKRIGGQGYCSAADVETGRKSYPIFWDLNEATGEYEIHILNNLQLPDHQGFFSTHMTPDGKWLVGKIYAGAGSNLECIVSYDGEVNYFHELDVREEEFIHDYYGSLGYFTEYYIDGVKDGYNESAWQNGCFMYATDEYLFGWRTQLSNVDLDAGTASFSQVSTIYDLTAGEFIDGNFGTLTCGYSPDMCFGTHAYVDGTLTSLTNYFDFSCSMTVGGIYDFTRDGLKLAGCATFFNEAAATDVDSPMLVICESSPIEARMTDWPSASEEGLKVVKNVVVTDGPIEYFDMQGRKLTNPEGGIFIRRQGNITTKEVR